MGCILLYCMSVELSNFSRALAIQGIVLSQTKKDFQSFFFIRYLRFILRGLRGLSECFLWMLLFVIPASVTCVFI